MQTKSIATDRKTILKLVNHKVWSQNVVKCKTQASQTYIFRILLHFTTKLCHFTHLNLNFVLLAKIKI